MMKKTYQLIIALNITLFSSVLLADECDGVENLLEHEQYTGIALIIDPLFEKGVACAQFYKGIMYQRGIKVTRDTQKGAILIKMAADKGYRKAIDYMKD